MFCLVGCDVYLLAGGCLVAVQVGFCVLTLCLLLAAEGLGHAAGLLRG